MKKIKDEHKRVFDIRKFKFDKNKRINLHQFTHIRGYHGCRVLDRESYKKNGLYCCSCEEAWKRCLQAFTNIDVSFDTLKQIFNERWNDCYSKKINQNIYFLLDKKGFDIDRCGSYVFYGSEFLYSVAVRIIGYSFSKKHEQFLNNIGKPSVITCDVPSEEIMPWFFDSIEELLNTNGINSSLAFAVKQVTPENIVSIRHYKGWISYWKEGVGLHRIRL